MAASRFEEIRLLALCMATDNREAFSRLVEMHQPGLRRFLLNLTGGDESLADDLAQETFIKAWLAIRSFHGLSGFRTWLYRIAINEFSTSRRRVSREALSDHDLTQISIEDAVARSRHSRNHDGCAPHGVAASRKGADGDIVVLSRRTTRKRDCQDNRNARRHGEVASVTCTHSSGSTVE